MGINKITTTLAAGAVALAACSTFAETISSTNYKIFWDVNDSGGGALMSSNYTLEGSVGQPGAIGSSIGSSRVLQAGFKTAPDHDGDLVKDFMDNCTVDPNTGQLDTNGDGYGNICDADLNNDGTINFGDLAQFKSVFFPNPYDPDADFNGDGFVNFGDLALLKFYFLSPPGPSGIAP